MRRRVALAVALPVAALGAVAAVVIASGGGDGGRQPAAAHRGGIELVARRTLVDRVQLDGTLGYGSAAAAMNRLDGTLTWLPSAGTVIRPGGRLFAVDGKPVILMDGSVPAWRTLAAGVPDGVDVRQLERNLAALGYDPGTVDESFTASTTAAVQDWQDALGLSQTGRVELGRVVFLRGPRRISKVDATLGGTGASSAVGAAWDGGAPQYAYADYTGGDGAATTPTTPSATPTTPATTPTAPSTTPTAPSTAPTTPSTTPTTPTAPSTAPTTPSTTPAAPASPAGGGGGDQNGGGGGGGGAAAAKVLSTTSTTQVVTADLDASDQALARVGVRATVTLPDDRRVTGRVVRVGTVVTDAGGDGSDPAGGDGGGDPTLPLTIRLRSTRAARHLDEAPVAVELARTTRRDVLAVPVAALVARSGGGYGVRVVRASGTAAEVPVQPGLFADGYVELTGGGVHAGDRVEVPK